MDNSGASKLLCIHVFKKGKNMKHASIGDLIKVSVKRLKKSIPKKKVKKGEVLNALIVSVRSPFIRNCGLSLKNNHNHAVIINKDLEGMVSNRVVMPMFLDIRKGGFSKLLTLAPGIL